MGKKSFLYMGRTYAANIVANGTSHSGGKFPCSILDKYTEVCKSLITEPNAHANNGINKIYRKCIAKRYNWIISTVKKCPAPNSNK